MSHGILDVLRVAAGGTTFVQGAEALGLTVEAFGNRVQTLVQMGYLREEISDAAATADEAPKSLACRFCPVADRCGVQDASACDTRTGRFYAVTDKGLALLGGD